MVGVLLAATAVRAAPNPGCQFAKVAELPVTMQGLRPVITSKINGENATFLLDSGAFYSNLTEAAAERFKLPMRQAPVGFYVSGVGGSVTPRIARVAEFTYAGFPLKNVEFLVFGGAPASGAAGIIGQNLLGASEVEFDLANGVIRLFNSKGCEKANLAYWAQGLDLHMLTVQVQTPTEPHIISEAKIDGNTVKVMFDTGATNSVISRGAAARAGIRTTSEGVTAGGLSSGIGRRAVETSIATFKELDLGNEEIHNAKLRVTDLGLGPEDLLIGADFFLSHRVMLARSQRRLYFTYTGGPVFSLGEAVKTPTPTVGAAAATGDGPKTAEEFERRGAASAARREFAAAADDYGKAIELSPDEPRYYRARATARLNNRQPVLAMADLSQALKLKPDDVGALMMRGELYLSQKDGAAAQADFDAAAKLAPQDTQQPLRVAVAYVRARQYDKGIRILNEWIAAHPNDRPVVAAREERCRARAFANKELDEALADCDAALKLGQRTSRALESRGLVLLRQGRYPEAIRQYDDAIHAQPKDAWALYGRGLARLKAGQAPEGKADLAAATAALPTIADEMKAIGLTAAEGG